MINYEYYAAITNQKPKIDEDSLWRVTLINDKKSSVGQAIHLKTKLKYLGITVLKSELKDKKKLEAHNTKVLDKALGIVNLSDRECSAEGKNKIDLIAQSEHNRWMALLFLMGYELNETIEQKDKIQKYHLLLKDLSSFTEDEFKKYVPYDRDAIVKIAKYEAAIGNELIGNNKI